MLLPYLAAAFVAGVYLASRASVLPLALLLGLVVALGAVALRRYRWPRLLLLGAAALCGGALRLATLAPPSQDLVAYNDRDGVEVEATIVAAPDIAGRRARYWLATRAITVEQVPRFVEGGVVLYAPLYPRYDYGDVLRLRGKLEAPPRLEDFDYGDYLARHGVFSVMRYPAIQVVAGGQAPLFWRSLHHLRGRLGEALAASLPEPQASLAQGILLGLRGNIPGDLYAAFNQAGATHIIAISGQNITIVAGMFGVAFAWALGRHRHSYLWLCLGAVWLYALLAGGAPSVIRAAIMGSLVLIASALGRPTSAIHSLALAGAVMVGHDPNVLCDLGFQLSFAAMFGLVTITPRLEPGADAIAGGLTAQGHPELAAFSHAVASVVAASVGATATTLPLLALAFQRLPLASLPTTLLGLPALPAIIVSSAVTAIGGLVFASIGQVAGWVAWPFLSYLIAVVELGAKLLPATSTGVISTESVVAYYAALAAIVFFGGRRRRPALRHAPHGPRAVLRLSRRVAVLAVATAAVWTLALTARDAETRVAFLDVGQGDAILIQASGRTVLVDGGPSPQAITNQLGQRLPFWQRDIDLVVLSHPHEDHLLGLIEVARRYQIDHVLETSCPLTDTGATYAEWRDVLAAKGAGTWTAVPGARVSLADGAFIEVLGPRRDSADANECSVVLRLVIGDVSFLLTGDIGDDAETDLTYSGVELASTILKIPHHGGPHSSLEAFLDRVQPTAAVISVGADNPYKHPNLKTLLQLGGSAVFRTDTDGSVVFTTDGHRLWVKTEPRPASPDA